jgi:hypothetical protein
MLVEVDHAKAFNQWICQKSKHVAEGIMKVSVALNVSADPSKITASESEGGLNSASSSLWKLLTCSPQEWPLEDGLSLLQMSHDGTELTISTIYPLIAEHQRKMRDEFEVWAKDEGIYYETIYNGYDVVYAADILSLMDRDTRP